jgi:hypothetical protein
VNEHFLSRCSVVGCDSWRWPGKQWQQGHFPLPSKGQEIQGEPCDKHDAEELNTAGKGAF